MTETSHKLEDTWCFWYSPRGKKSTENSENYYKQIKPVGNNPEKLSFFNNKKKIGEFNTVEGFFSFYCFIQRPSEIPIDNKLMMFRKGCMPLWEVFII